MIFGIVAVALAGFISAISASPSEDEGDWNGYESIYTRSSNNRGDTNISSYKTKSIWQIGNVKPNLTGAQKKLSTDLLQLVDNSPLPQGQDRKTLKMQMKRLRQFRPASSMPASSDGMMTDDMVYVYIYLTPHAETQTIEPYVVEVTDVSERDHLAVAWVEVNDLETLASQEEVRTIRTVMPPILRTGSVTTEGDTIHHTYDMRTAHSRSGSGVNVGIISDGVDHWTDARNSGDLPADLAVLNNRQGGDEGTAMLEIVHDMVPDAALYFHDWGDNTVAFNAAIDALVDAGCDVICDDVAWIEEPFFEDGIIASHITSMLASNDIVYVSSAGNAGQEHYQGDYYNDGYDFHDKVWYIDFAPGSSAIIVLQWNDEFGASGNDYDLYLCDYYAGEVLFYSEGIQDGDDDPIEFIDAINTESSIIECFIVVANYNGAAATKTLEVFIYPENGASVYTDNIDPADSIFGHPAVPSVIAVGAIDASDPGNDDIEDFSSQGPATISYPAPVCRPKPDLCGVDGVTVTGAGGFPSPFYGTSAAAPHIAAIAAQFWGACPSKTGYEIRAVLRNTAVDLGSAGYDDVYGYGRADAFVALAPPNIISSTPPSNVSNTEGIPRTYSIVVNQTVNVNWYINGTSVQTNTSVTEASYMNMSTEVGMWNVSSVASNTNGTATQTWIWNITEVPPAFTTADAVIALEIAVGSRPHNDVMDVNNDGCVTSLDALMILQAVAGAISL
ncbi:MAG: Subtilase family protein [Candidatus Argoarchaeum ethanivorans]|uniref:Subtilase family protein n=1 Tax=Candidatus Argoarchaeum ethanivorans TaxID=2608793 RepID=A0A811T7S0_9EURY|nr:MAG: Subtilase family protein [Candidatus Argoarchaeum ethanivorans]